MAIKFAKDNVAIKTETVNSENVVSKDSTAEVLKTEWEFFKTVKGFLTDKMNAQINIPSTAFTPDFSMPTKEAFMKILMAKAMFDALSTRVKQLSNAVNGTSSDAAKQKAIVKRQIEKALSKNGGNK